MNIHELSALYYKKQIINRYNQQLSEKREKLDKLKSDLLSVPGMKMDGMPHGGEHQNRTDALIFSIGLLEGDISNIEKRLAVEMLDYSRKERELQDLIDRCEEERVRLILQYRFIDLLSWNKVADNIGGYNTEDSVKKACYRYLKKSESCPICPDAQ